MESPTESPAQCRGFDQSRKHPAIGLLEAAPFGPGAALREEQATGQLGGQHGQAGITVSQ